MTHRNELDAVSEEVATLDKMAEGVGVKIRELKATRSGAVGSDAVAIGVLNARSGELKGYEELAHHVYGSCVLGRVTDGDGKLKKSFVYRITQANVSYIDQGCYVLPRNAPRASKLITAQPGDEVEVPTRDEDEYLEIDEIRVFDGATGLLRPGRKPDFRMMSLKRRDQKRPLVVENLRAAISALPAGHQQSAASAVATSADVALPPSPQAVKPVEAALIAEAPLVENEKFDADPTWLRSWKGVYLASSDSQSLGHEFFTRTTVAQEGALVTPRGLTYVEGIAGAGKTSVALGRLKFFSNFGTGQHLNDYGLQNAPLADFSPSGMMGFVLSHSLKHYLRETAASLDLERLPIKDFDEFRKGLATEYGLTKSFRSSRTAAHPLRTRMAWIRALDAGVARAAAKYLRDSVTRLQNLEPGVRSSVLKLAHELGGAKPVAGVLNVHRLAERIRKAVEAGGLGERERELGRQEEAIRSRYASDSAERQRRIARLNASFEKKTDSTTARKLLAGMRIQDLYLRAVTEPNFRHLLKAAIETDKAAVDGELESLDDALTSLLELLNENDEDGRPSLTDADLVGTICLAGLIADGFERTASQAIGLSHLYDMRSCTGVFIDEVQDFNDVQILLMGLCVTDTYSQVTISGDMCQQLHDGGARKFGHLFPLIPRQRINSSVFLDVNFRQRDPMARFANGLRAKLLGDTRLSANETPTAALHVFDARRDLARNIAKRIKQVNDRATIAVICGSKADARIWFDLLEEDLGAEHRSPLMSERESLTRRFDVHFTDALEAKGLEFDVVFVPDLAAFDLQHAIGRNSLYVAVSRAKHSLLIGCESTATDRPEEQAMIDSGLLRVA